ncbi:MAG: hypothetical protein IT427_10400 [Pirellulales bacterium]|nr:hypothetical protein [Pirellulales bacterium]
MTERRSFYRKIAYIVAIAVLIVPLYVLGRPASLDVNGALTKGGTLAQERDTHGLAQASLGEIDPASETAKLATLGLRGVAVVMLWNRAQHYQMVEDWMSLRAVLEQITRLQPNFFSIWDFQAHNLSYNISVEFDDYRDRFTWVMDGIEFLKKGLDYNQSDPRFPAKIGWFYGNKIGRADEKVQYRRLFKKLQEEKGAKLTDNWLVSYEWYRNGQKLVDSGKRLRVYITGHPGASQTKPGERAPGPLLFHDSIPMALISYAENLEEDGVIGDQAKTAWENAAASWDAYKKRDLMTSYGYSVHLEDLEALRGQIESLGKKLEDLLPGERESIFQEKRAKLSEAQRAILDKKPAERTADESQIGYAFEQQTKVTWEEVALRAPAEQRAAAREISAEIADLEQKANTIDTYRDIVNFNYWNERCRVEPTDACIEARTLLRDAAKAYYPESDLVKSAELYEQAFKKWDEVLKISPILRTNSIMADDLVEEINKYKKVLGQSTGADLPTDFVLQDLIDLQAGKQPASTPAVDQHDESEHDKTKSHDPEKSGQHSEEGHQSQDKRDEGGQQDGGIQAEEKKADSPMPISAFRLPCVHRNG